MARIIIISLFVSYLIVSCYAELYKAYEENSFNMRKRPDNYADGADKIRKAYERRRYNFNDTINRPTINHEFLKPKNDQVFDDITNNKRIRSDDYPGGADDFLINGRNINFNDAISRPTINHENLKPKNDQVFDDITNTNNSLNHAISKYGQELAGKPVPTEVPNSIKMNSSSLNMDNNNFKFLIIAFPIAVAAVIAYFVYRYYTKNKKDIPVLVPIIPTVQRDRLPTFKREKLASVDNPTFEEYDIKPRGLGELDMCSPVYDYAYTISNGKIVLPDNIRPCFDLPNKSQHRKESDCADPEYHDYCEINEFCNQRKENKHEILPNQDPRLQVLRKPLTKPPTYDYVYDFRL